MPYDPHSKQLGVALRVIRVGVILLMSGVGLAAVGFGGFADTAAALGVVVGGLLMAAGVLMHERAMM